MQKFSKTHVGASFSVHVGFRYSPHAVLQTVYCLYKQLFPLLFASDTERHTETQKETGREREREGNLETQQGDRECVRESIYKDH